MDLTHRPTTNPLVVLREESDDWALLFHPDSGDTYGLNPTSVAIWKSIDGSRSIGKICQAIQERFVNIPDNVDDLVVEFMASLEARGLITILPPMPENEDMNV